MAQTGSLAAVNAALINFHLEEASAQVAALNSPALEAYCNVRILFMKLVASEDLRWQTRLEETVREAVPVIEALPEADCRRRVMIGEIYFLRGASRILSGSLIGGGLDISRACVFISDNIAEFPACVEQYKLQGLMQVAMSSVPRKWKWLGEFLCLPGDLNGGMQKLKASQQSSLLPGETEILLFYLEKNLLSRSEAARTRMRTLAEANPGSFAYSLLYVSSLMESRMNDQALALLESRDADIRADKAIFYSPLWDYFRAKAHYFRLDYAQAVQYFDQFLRQYKGRVFFADAVFRKGMALSMAGNYTAAKPLFQQLSGAAVSGFDEDDYARAMAHLFAGRPPRPSELQLFRARNLFDGGYYTRSLEHLQPLLSAPASLNADEQTELYYRMGRIWQESGNPAKARQFYLSCVKTQPGPNLWMKVYAHYYLGMIAKGEGNKEAARNWMALALGFSGYFYQSGLEQRCKAALQDLR